MNVARIIFGIIYLLGAITNIAVVTINDSQSYIGLALVLGSEVGVPLPIGTVVQQGLNAAVDAGYGEKSVQSVILLLEEKTGVKVRTFK